MKTVFSYRLRRLRGQILGWGIALALLGLMMVSFYNSIADQREQFDQLLEAYPKELLAFFGDVETFTTPAGYLGVIVSVSDFYVFSAIFQESGYEGLQLTKRVFEGFDHTDVGALIVTAGLRNVFANR